MTTRMRSQLSWAARLLISAVVLYLVLVNVPLDQVLHELGSANPYLVVLAWSLFVWTFHIGAVTFRLLTERHDMSLSTGEIFEINLAIQFYSLFLPGSVSSLLRWYKFARSAQKPIEALAVVVSSRIAYTLALALAGLLCALADLRPGLTIPTLTLAGVLVVSAGLYLISFSRVTFRQARRVIGVLVFVPASIQRRLADMLTVLEQGQGVPARVHATLIGLSVLRNLIVLLQAYILALALGLSLSPATVGWIWSFTAILVMLPVSLAGLGVREASLVVLLAPLGVPEASAVGLSFLWLSSFLASAAVGGILEGRRLLLRGAPAISRVRDYRRIGRDRSIT